MLLELLEGRRLLAGNVVATYDGGTDTITVSGDNKSNAILIEGFAAVGVYTITGLGGTTVNGLPAAIVVDTSAGLPGPNFKISMGNGDDFVGTSTANGWSANAIDISTGNGEDEVSLPNVTAYGGLEIETGNGKDFVHMGWVDVHDHLHISTGNGSDEVFFDTFLGNGTTVFGGGTAVVNGGNGPDKVSLLANLNDTDGNPLTPTIVNFEDIS